MTKFDSVETYLGSLPPEVAQRVEQVRGVVHQAVPGAGEKIAYDIPTFTLGGRSFVHVAGWKKHLSIYPAPDDADLAPELVPYLAGSGTLKFVLAEPLPLALIARVVERLAGRSLAGRALADGAGDGS